MKTNSNIQKYTQDVFKTKHVYIFRILGKFELTNSTPIKTKTRTYFGCSLLGPLSIGQTAAAFEPASAAQDADQRADLASVLALAYEHKHNSLRKCRLNTDMRAMYEQY